MKKKQRANGTPVGAKKESEPAKKKLAMRTDIPIEHAFPAEQRATYSNHFSVLHENGVFHLMFFQINPPLTLGSHEEKAQKLRELKAVQATCVARMIVAEELMPKIIEALVDNFSTQQARAAGQVEMVDVGLTTQNRKESV